MARSSKKGGGKSADEEVEGGDGFGAEAGLEAVEEFGLEGAAEFHQEHGVVEAEGENAFFEFDGFGEAAEGGAGDVGPGALHGAKVGGFVEVHALEGGGDEVGEGLGGGGGVGGNGVGAEAVAFAVDLPLAAGAVEVAVAAVGVVDGRGEAGMPGFRDAGLSPEREWGRM